MFLLSSIEFKNSNSFKIFYWIGIASKSPTLVCINFDPFISIEIRKILGIDKK